MPGVLALLAHPDDEFFCSGLLSALSAHGVPVHLVYWTRGEGGGSPRSRMFWSCFPRNWRPRVREARKVAHLLRPASLTFLDAVDPVPNPELQAPDEDNGEVIDKLSRVTAVRLPEMIITHGSQGEYGHPAHRRLLEVALEFVGRSLSIPLLSFNATWPECPPVDFLNPDDSADFVLDTEPYLEQKRKIAFSHRSQRGVLESLVGPEATIDDLLKVTREEGYHCWNGTDAALERLQHWLAIPASV